MQKTVPLPSVVDVELLLQHQIFFSDYDMDFFLTPRTASIYLFVDIINIFA